MNINHHQTKRDRSYFEWSDNIQIVRKGNGDIAMTESELIDFFGVTWRKLNYRLQLLIKVSFLHPEEKDAGEVEVYVNGQLKVSSALSAFNHHRFVLSIGQCGSPLVQEIHLSRDKASYTYGRTDIPIWTWQYQLIHFSLSPVSIYDITTKDIKL